MPVLATRGQAVPAVLGRSGAPEQIRAEVILATLLPRPDRHLQLWASIYTVRAGPRWDGAPGSAHLFILATVPRTFIPV